MSQLTEDIDQWLDSCNDENWDTPCNLLARALAELNRYQDGITRIDDLVDKIREVNK